MPRQTVFVDSTELLRIFRVPISKSGYCGPSSSHPTPRVNWPDLEKSNIPRGSGNGVKVTRLSQVTLLFIHLRRWQIHANARQQWLDRAIRLDGMAGSGN
jgi:hypothetical protein